jgi:hypothetical protein
MILLCPLCGDEEEVQRLPAGDGAWQYECTRRSKWHPDQQPYRWTARDTASPTATGGGSVRDTTLGAALLACVLPGEPWVEYGIVEHRCAENHPAAFRKLVLEKGHRWWSPDGVKKTHPNVRRDDMTASRYLVRTLSALAAAGALTRQFSRGTGTWAYNSTISYWALPPAPPADRQLSYETFRLTA